jgi:arylsulfatase A-like enzyme
MQTPNILYLHTHDTGRWIEPYGFFAPTPNLMRLAQEGVLFRQAFCAAPTCSPSRAALLTGQAPHAAGMLGLAHLGWGLSEPEHHLANFLSRQGYETHLCGVQHVATAERVDELGYSAINSQGQAAADEYAIRVLRERASTPLEKRAPLFLDVGLFEPHRSGFGFGLDDGLTDARYVPVPAGLPDTPEVRRDVADFAAAVQRADYRLGRVLGALRESGEAENTLVIYTTDHGPAFPLYKCNLSDKGIGVSLIVRGPGFGGGEVCDALVSHLDLFPTICDVLGAPRPDWLEGESLCGSANGREREIHEALFSEVTFHAGWEPMRAARTTRWKYIRRYVAGESAGPVLANCDDGASKRLWMEQGGFCARPTEELYDLVLDPQEMVNLAAQPQFAPTLDEMRKRLDEWMKVTDDPLRSEYFAVPAHAKLSEPDAVHPGGIRRTVGEIYPEFNLERWPARRPG